MADRAQWVKDIMSAGKIPVSAWGSFKLSGLSAFKSPSSIPARNTVCVDNYDSTAAYLKDVKAWYPSPYMTGVQGIYEMSSTDKDKMLTHIFPVAWWNAARADLKTLFLNQPKTDYETIAWTIHVGWIVYHMLLASNVYPIFWSEALKYAKNPKWVPPDYGWDMTLPHVSGTRAKGYPGDSNTSTSQPLDPLALCWLWQDPGEGWTSGVSWGFDWEHKTQLGSFISQEKPIWWSGKFSISTIIGSYTKTLQPNLGLAINEIPWSGKTIYATYVGVAVASLLNDPVPKDETFDAWAFTSGLGTLTARARFFHRGGLPDLAKIYMDAPASAKERLKRDWNLRANALINMDYWTFVRAGVTTWRYRTGLPLAVSKGPSAMGAGEVILMPTCRQDIKVIYNEFMKSWRQSFIVAPMIKFGAWLINAIKTSVRGDFIGMIKGQVDFQKWGKQYAKQTANAPADPYFFFWTMPPLFLRSPGDTFNAFSDQVVMDANKEVTETGTEALYMRTETGVRALEKTLAVKDLWEPSPPVIPQPTAEPVVIEKVKYSVQTAPGASGLDLPTSSKIWWGFGGVLAVAGFLLWRRK